MAKEKSHGLSNRSDCFSALASYYHVWILILNEARSQILHDISWVLKQPWGQTKDIYSSQAVSHLLVTIRAFFSLLSKSVELFILSALFTFTSSGFHPTFICMSCNSLITFIYVLILNNNLVTKKSTFEMDAVGILNFISKICEASDFRNLATNFAASKELGVNSWIFLQKTLKAF